MKQRLQKWVTHNLLLKIIALLVAILLWFMFYTQQDPMDNENFRVPVEVRHEEEFRGNGHFVSIEDGEDLGSLELDVVLKARASVLEEMRSKDVSSFVKAYVDLYELEGNNTNRLIIHYEKVPGAYASRFDLVDMRNKSYYAVKVDDSATKEIEVRYEVSGKPEDGYMVLPNDEDIQLNPTTITLTGPSNQLEEIAYGKVTARVANANANVNVTNDIVLYTSADEVYSYSRDVIYTSISTASVFVPVYKTKTVKLQPVLKGNVADGYEYGNDVTTSVEKVEIFGPESEINKINSILLPEIDLSNMTENYAQTYDLNEILHTMYPSSKVRVVEGNETTAELKFSVGKQESKTISIPTSRISVSGQNNNWNASFVSNTLQLKIVGLAQNLEAFSEEDILLSVRLKENDFIEGRHQVEVSVTGTGLNLVKLAEEPVEIEMEFSSLLP